MRMKERLFNACLNDNLMGEIKDKPIVSDLARRIERKMRELPRELSKELSPLLSDWMYYYTLQAFELGFDCATKIIMDGEIGNEEK